MLRRLLTFVSLALCPALALAQTHTTVTVEGNQTITGNKNFKGTINCTIVNVTRCIEPSNSQGWAGSDFGAWNNSAYASCVADRQTTCDIQVAAGTYSFSTPVVWGSSLVGVRMQCQPGGTILNFTGSSGNAITPNWDTGNADPHQQKSGTGISGCTLTGTGSGTANGIEMNGGNGVTGFVIYGCDIKSFGGNGVDFANVANTSFFVTIQETAIHLNNGVGVNLVASSENVRLLNDAIGNNATGFVQTGSSSDTYAEGTSFDGNTTTGVNLSAGVFGCKDCHFENSGGPTSPNFITQSGGKLFIVGGLMLNDTIGIGDAQFVTASAGTLFAAGIDIESNSAVTQVFNLSGTATPTFVGIVLGSANVLTLFNSSYTGAVMVLSPSQANFWQGQDLQIHAPGAVAATLHETAGSVFQIGVGSNHLAVGGTTGPNTTDTSFAPSVAGAADVGTTALPFGNLWLTGVPIAKGTISVAGTGACATITTKLGGARAGQFTCAGRAGASTVVITPGITAPNGFSCFASDLTTAANVLRQSAVAATTCTIAGTVNANDVITFGVEGY